MTDGYSITEEKYLPNLYSFVPANHEEKNPFWRLDFNFSLFPLIYDCSLDCEGYKNWLINILWFFSVVDSKWS